MSIQKDYFWILPLNHTWYLFTLLLLFNIGKEKKNKIKLSDWEFRYQILLQIYTLSNMEQRVRWTEFLIHVQSEKNISLITKPFWLQ